MVAWKKNADRYALDKARQCSASNVATLGGRIQCKVMTSVANTWMNNYLRARKNCLGS